MTINEALALGRRMMACKGFEWRPGMHALPSFGHAGGVVVEVERDGFLLFHGHGEGQEMVDMEPADRLVPDPRDPGVVGHALAMMRAAYDDGSLCPTNRVRQNVWHIFGTGRGHPFHESPTEVEVIVNAWEALS